MDLVEFFFGKLLRLEPKSDHESAAARRPPREFRSRRVPGAARSEIDFLGRDGGTHENSSTCGGPNDRAYESVADLGIGLLGICPDSSATGDLSATADLARRSTRHHRRGGRLHPRPEFEHGGRCSGRSWKSGVADKMDGTTINNTRFAEGKAFASAILRQTTEVLANLAKDRPDRYFGIMNMYPGKVYLVGGGVPLTVDARLVGAVGVAGLPKGVDEKAARAGMAAWDKFRQSMKK